MPSFAGDTSAASAFDGILRHGGHSTAQFSSAFTAAARRWLGVRMARQRNCTCICSDSVKKKSSLSDEAIYAWHCCIWYSADCVWNL